MGSTIPALALDVFGTVVDWYGSVEGVERLKHRYVVCTLSNGNIALLTHMAKNAALPWDCILSAEVFRRYKPDPTTYLGVARTFDVAPHEVMMVAAHHGDLRAARECGLRCAFVERPLEYGPDGDPDVSRDPEDDCHARNLIELADTLHGQYGCNFGTGEADARSARESKRSRNSESAGGYRSCRATFVNSPSDSSVRSYRTSVP